MLRLGALRSYRLLLNSFFFWNAELKILICQLTNLLILSDVIATTPFKHSGPKRDQDTSLRRKFHGVHHMNGRSPLV